MTSAGTFTIPADYAVDGIVHGFFTRNGGVSHGLYRALNCGPGSGDDPAAVVENRRRASACLGVRVENLCTVHQVHGSRAVTVEAPWKHEERPRADALVTSRPGVALGILTADCAPVLFADPKARVIGAAHAGWQGALGGVLETAIEAMEELGAQRPNIRALIGPSIAQDSYEVGAEFVARFLAADAGNAAFFRGGKREGHHHFDLVGFVKARLAASGVTAAALAIDTYANEDLCFSYRRATHRGEADYGRLLSAIALTPDPRRSPPAHGNRL